MSPYEYVEGTHIFNKYCNSNWLYKTIRKLSFLGKMQFELNTTTLGMKNKLEIEL